MTDYHVSYMVIYSDEVEANSPKEAADIVARDCPYDVDGLAYVTNLETDERFEV